MTVRADRRVVVASLGRGGRVYDSRPPGGGAGVRSRLEIERTPTHVDDVCRVWVWGLSQGEADALAARDRAVAVSFGWGGDARGVFAGVIQPGSVDRQTRRPEVVTRFTISDSGTIARRAVFARSYPHGGTASQVIRDAAAAAGLAVGRIDLGIDRTYDGLLFAHTVSEVFDLIADDTGSRHSIRSGAITMWPRDGAPGVRIWRIRAGAGGTGLLDGPSARDGGQVEVRHLAEPWMVPGDRADVRGTARDGVWRVGRIRTTIDSGYDAMCETIATLEAAP